MSKTEQELENLGNDLRKLATFVAQTIVAAEPDPPAEWQALAMSAVSALEGLGLMAEFDYAYDVYLRTVRQTLPRHTPVIRRACDIPEAAPVAADPHP